MLTGLFSANFFIEPAASEAFFPKQAWYSGFNKVVMLSKTAVIRSWVKVVDRWIKYLVVNFLSNILFRFNPSNISVIHERLLAHCVLPSPEHHLIIFLVKEPKYSYPGSPNPKSVSKSIHLNFPPSFSRQIFVLLPGQSVLTMNCWKIL